MEEKNKEFTLAQEHAAPPPECAALPPEVLPPDTVLPGEASAADIGIAGGRGEGLLFRKGEILYKVPQEQLVDALMAEIEKL